MKRLPTFLILAAALALSACALAPVARPARFTLDTRSMARAPLSVTVSAASWLDGRDMYYRLAYRDPHRLYRYAGSAWASAVPNLVGERIDPAPQAGMRTLDIRLNDFSQVFSSPTDSVGRVDASLSLRDGRDGRLVDSTRLSVEKPAGADAAAGVAALSAASDELLARALRWAAQHP